MARYYGDAVVNGIVTGPIYVLRRKKENTEAKIQVDWKDEWQKVLQAISCTVRQLNDLTEKARSYAGDQAANIFEAHQLILLDEEFREEILTCLQDEQVDGETAVAKAGEKFANMFASMDQGYMRAREADIRDITNRILQNMEHAEAYPNREYNGKPVILIAESLNPSDIFRFGKESILAFVTTKGSVTSHAAILGRSMNVPAVIHVSHLTIDELQDGQQAIVDAEKNLVILNPTEEEMEIALRRQAIYQEEQEQLKAFIGMKSVTKDGHPIAVNANISDIEETQIIQQIGGDGVGLFRSEFLYMGRKSFPTEEEQFNNYCALIKKMNGKKVIVRTMDIGSDKQLDYFHMAQETNPAFGCRGIRVSLRYPEIFKVQLRALFRAAVYGDLSIMYPMITSTVELDNIQKVIDEVVKELEEKQEPFRIPPQGIMIETPAAVMIGDELAERVDFFSIGTNDLAQYALGIDRNNTDLDMMQFPQHEGIIRMIEHTIQAAHRHGIWVGVCGEMASDETLLKRFVQMGVDEVSVSVNHILKVRKIFSEL